MSVDWISTLMTRDLGLTVFWEASFSGTKLEEWRLLDGFQILELEKDVTVSQLLRLCLNIDRSWIGDVGDDR